MALVNHRYTPAHWAEVGECWGRERRAQPHDHYHGRNETMTLQNQHDFIARDCPSEKPHDA